jgi:outer membrane protein OmpA-like peptidoglycan-associated protein
MLNSGLNIYKYIIKSVSIRVLVIGFLVSKALTLGAFANTLGHTASVFHSSAGLHDYAALTSAQVLKERQQSYSLFVDYSDNSLPTTQAEIGQNDHLVQSNLSASIGLKHGWELGVQLPLVIAQSTNQIGDRSQFIDFGNTEISAYGKWKSLRLDDFSLSMASYLYLNRLQDDSYHGINSKLGVGAELIGRYLLGRSFELTSTVGFRLQQRGEDSPEALISPVGDRLSWGAGVRKSLENDKTSISAEVYGSLFLADQWRNETSKGTAPAEILIAAQRRMNKLIKLHGGASAGVSNGLTAPDMRVIIGVDYLTEPDVRGRSHKLLYTKKRKNKKRSRRNRVSQRVNIEPKIREYKRPRQAVKRPAIAITLTDIMFDFDSDFQVLVGGLKEVEKLAKVLKKNTYERILIEGHCDYIGTEQYNMALSRRRARNVARYLILYYGIDANQIRFVGRGKSAPISTDRSVMGRQKNRRVEVKIYKRQQSFNITQRS